MTLLEKCPGCGSMTTTVEGNAAIVECWDCLLAYSVPPITTGDGHGEE